jgi:hypothetical protein
MPRFRTVRRWWREHSRRVPTPLHGPGLRGLCPLSYSRVRVRAHSMGCMSGRLRHIALTVEQTGPRSYGWVLIESAGGRVFVLKKSPAPSSSYLTALAGGYEELALLSACGLHERGLEQSPGEAAATVSAALELAELHDAL